MVQHLRWQIGLAVVGVVAIGLVLLLFAEPTLENRPARGGELVEAAVGRPAVFNPLFAVEQVERDVGALLFCALSKPGPRQHLRPDLATHWSISPDGLRYTFELRANARWHDGRPVTARDVVFTAEMARAVAADGTAALTASPLVRPWAQVTAEAVNDHTVVLRLTEPYAPFLEATMLGLLPEHLLAGTRPRDLLNHRYSRAEPIGCGPYRLELPGGLDSARVRLVGFPDHWDATDRKPFLDAVTFRFFPDVDAALAALGQRDVQAMGGVPAAAFASLGDEARFYSAVQPGYALVYLGPGDVLFSDPQVRQALSLGVNRDALVHDPDLLNGQGQVAASPIAPGSWAWYPEAAPPPYDPARARALLDQAGWVDSDDDSVRDRDGKPLLFTLGVADDPLLRAVAERLAGDWRDIGVRAEVQPLGQQALVSTLTGRDFDALLFTWQLRAHDPDPYPLWHSSQIADGQNYAGFANADADRVLVAARRLPPTEENLNERAGLYRVFQDLFVRERPALTLYHPVYTYAVVDPNLGGVQLPQLLVDPADRFMTLADWFVRTERVWRENRQPAATGG